MQELLAAVDAHKERIENAFHYIWKNPETGFKEWKTHAYLAKEFRALGYELTEAGNIPGFYTDLDTGRPGPTVLVLGELDALICKSHPDADPETGAVHCCGHCCQTAALLGLAAGLKEPGALDALCGKIRFMAVPAEELIEVEYREQLREQGVIRYLGGKMEFMSRGYMDGVDIAFMIHTSVSPSHVGVVRSGANGCLAKTVTFTGVSAHAGGSPHKGINALYAASQGLNAINALRETFQDNHHIRVHPIITCGGTVVNAIPEKVTMESFVRGADLRLIMDANRKINRALAASAAALGANVTIKDRLGASPLNNNKGLMKLAKEAMEMVMEKVDYNEDDWGTSGTDMGDVTMVMPAIHPKVGGAVGPSHSNSYFIQSVDSACVESAKVQAVMLGLLLKNGAERAYEIKKNYKSAFASIQDFLNYVDSINMVQQAVSYNEDGTVTLKFEKSAQA